MAVKTQKHQSVIEAYGDRIPTMITEGYPDTVIAEMTGVTRSRIGQIRKDHYPLVKRTTLTEIEVTRLLCCSTERLKALRHKGLTHPRQLGKLAWFYTLEQVKAISLMLIRCCPHCGVGYQPAHNHRYCLKCSREHKRYNYPFMSEEQKAKLEKSSLAWRAAHPEKWRKSMLKASRKYWATHRKKGGTSG